MLCAASGEHVEIAVGEALVGLLVDRIERIHQAIAEGIGIDVERRMDEVRNVDPEILVSGLEIDRRPEALALHLEPDLAQALRRELAFAPLGVPLAFEAVERDL